MFNKILLICLLLTHLPITAFAIVLDETPKKPWFRLCSSNAVVPLAKTDTKTAMDANIEDNTPSSMLERRSKMPWSIRLLDFNPNVDKMPPFFQIKGFSRTPIYVPIFQQHRTNLHVRYLDNDFFYKNGLLDITDKDLTLCVNNLMKTDDSFCIIGKYGKFCLNGNKENFTELPLNTSWYIIKSHGKVTGLSAEFYEENEYNKHRAHGANITVYKGILLVPFRSKYTLF